MGMRNDMRDNMMRDDMRDNMMRNDMRDNMMHACSSNNDCGDEQFCNFDKGNTGYCETCSHIDSCRSGFTEHGMISCMQRCEYHDKHDTRDSNSMMRSSNMNRESSCTSNGDCQGDEWFCDFEHENTGYCRSCSSFNSCENFGFTTKHGMISCEQTCEYQDKNVYMNDRYRMPSYSILAQ